MILRQLVIDDLYRDNSRKMSPYNSPLLYSGPIVRWGVNFDFT